MSINNPPAVDCHRYLLFCADKSQFLTHLENIDLTGMSDDRELWAEARRAHRRKRTRRAQIWSGQLQVLFTKPPRYRFLEVYSPLPFHSIDV